MITQTCKDAHVFNAEMDPALLNRRAEHLYQMECLGKRGGFTPLHYHTRRIRALLPNLTAQELLGARPLTRIHCRNKNLTGRVIEAMLELDRLTEELLADLGNTIERRWGFVWTDTFRRALYSCEGEEAREKIRAALFTKTGRLKASSYRWLPCDTPQAHQDEFAEDDDD